MRSKKNKIKKEEKSESKVRAEEALDSANISRMSIKTKAEGD